MSWPWKFVDLDDAGKQLRRQIINRHAGIAQISAFGPLFAVLLYRLALWAHRAYETRRRSGSAVYSAVPESPFRKKRRQSPLGSWEARYRRLMWWLGDDVMFLGSHWGRRDEWVFGLGWGLWMGVLCVVDTGDGESGDDCREPSRHGTKRQLLMRNAIDYLHLTKRIGAIAISQLPLQYMLALKNLNPIAFVLRSSHEEINRFHRSLGRIIYCLLMCHALLYINFFVEKSLLLEKLTSSRAVQTGILGIMSMDALTITAWKAIRTYSYRLFFITHLAVAMLIPPLIWFHAHSARTFLVEALAVFLVDIIARKFDTTTTASATITAVPDTNLLKITAPIPASKLSRFTAHPGAHLLLQLPAVSRPTQAPLSHAFLVHEFLFNPFTVAAVDPDHSEATLVARHLRGPATTALKQLADRDGGGRSVSLMLEGPYGVSSVYSSLSSGEYDRVLLVAGGVGATYTLPLYRALVEDSGHRNSPKVQFVWAVRGEEELAWVAAEDGEEEKPLEQQPGVEIFITGGAAADGSVETVQEEGMELKEREAERVRPDLRRVVDGVFRLGQEESVAVVFCGPAGMGRELRGWVGGWVRRGRVVFWHCESFEW